ncbi:MAG: hypothetical protein D4S02_04275 [Rhodocyclaceae bacterium]|nr:MAG: hypothetical protein D4S02_04275 [Rhodocyclaceae bacterium]
MYVRIDIFTRRISYRQARQPRKVMVGYFACASRTKLDHFAGAGKMIVRVSILITMRLAR